MVMKPDYDAIDAAAYGPISIDGPDVAGRILESARRELRADGITPRQVAAVLHALADYSLQQRMVSDSVAQLAMRPLAYETEPNWPELAHGLGRFFHGVADRIEHRAWESEHRLETDPLQIGDEVESRGTTATVVALITEPCAVVQYRNEATELRPLMELKRGQGPW